MPTAYLAPSAAALTSSAAALEYARLLLRLHELFCQGKEEGEEPDAIRDQMEAPWYRMTPSERERMRGLSEDLYAVAEGGPPQVAMDDQKLQVWKNEVEECKGKYLQGDVDAWLAFWRKPRPSNFPPPHGNSASVVYFLQARCWDKLGDYETATLFMKAAEKGDPELAGLVLDLLHHAGNLAEEREYANRILEDQRSKPVFVYMAACYLFGQVSHSKDQREPLCKRLIPILKRAIKRERQIAVAERDLPDTEMNLVKSLGMCYELLGNYQGALSLYESALAQNPTDLDLGIDRAVALYYSGQEQGAYALLEEAAKLNSPRCLPYLLLAQRDFNSGRYWQAKDLAQKASEREGTSQLVSLSHQIIAMSLCMVGQSIDWVLDNFRLAEKLDPDDPTIAHNRAVALTRRSGKQPPETWSLQPPSRSHVAEMKPPDVGNRINQRRFDHMLAA